MAQFDVHLNLAPSGQGDIPYLLDIQSDLLSDLTIRVVVPLVKAATFGPAANRLNPAFEIGGETLVMSTAEIAGVPRKILGKVVGTLGSERDRIVAALDFVVQGI
jgi:toxin CcdB